MGTCSWTTDCMSSLLISKICCRIWTLNNWTRIKGVGRLNLKNSQPEMEKKMAEVKYSRGWLTTESWFLLTFSKEYQWDLKYLIKKWHLSKKCNMKLQSSLQLKACDFGVNISPSWNLLPWVSLSSDLSSSRVAICWETF